MIKKIYLILGVLVFALFLSSLGFYFYKDQLIESVQLIRSQKEFNKFCDTLEGEFKEECRNDFYRMQAIFNNDIALCEKYESQEQKNNCKDAYILSVDFLRDIRNFDCDSLNLSINRIDCRTFKEYPVACEKFKNDLFKSLCKSMEAAMDIERAEFLDPEVD